LLIEPQQNNTVVMATAFVAATTVIVAVKIHSVVTIDIFARKNFVS